MTKQTVTSANTSINKSKMPAIYGKIRVDMERVLDYGCGRYTEHLYNFCKSNYAAFFPYDPYNQPQWKNEISCKLLKENPATVGIMSNVLNVIDSEDAIKDAIEHAVSMIRADRFLYITIYEGDRSGVGKYTSKDSYQRNMRTKDYIPMLVKMGFLVEYWHGMILVAGKAVKAA